MTITAPELGPFAAQCHDVAAQLRDLTDDNREAAQLAMGQAVQLAPRRTGRLADSHQVVAVGDFGAVVAAVPYAVPVEARTHYLARAWASSQDRIVELYADRVQQLTERTIR